MADLFDQLKSEGPVKISSSPAKSVSLSKSNFTNTFKQFKEKCKSDASTNRRESLPSNVTVSSSVVKKSKSQKARSLSPPKHCAKNVLKSLKVKLERKKLEEFLTRPLEEHANDIRNNQELKNISTKRLKITPTKAQQKLFEPLVEQCKSKSVVLKDFNIKPCKVRIHRVNLQKLSKEFKNKASGKKDGKLKNNKRPASSGSSESPPNKKGKISTAEHKNNKNKNNFYIKLNTSPSKLDKKLKTISRESPSSEALHNKIKNSKFDTITAPTKFSRSALFRSFGKRFFNVHVKIERCTHPLMLTFESNDRARRLQAKRNKSKNLSVSFREQVEIFGGSSDSDDSCGEDFSAMPTNRNSRKISTTNSIPADGTPVVMPARLKKVENGKVVDDIELDPSLFLDPKMLISSTPFSPIRKKRDHKSFSPLKDETSPSPRREKLKLANEGIPPGGLKRLNLEEEDDEDDDCEYIVPIELPQRRTSRTSSNTTLDELTSLPLAISPLNFPLIFTSDNIDFNTTKIAAEMNKCTKNNTANLNAGTEISILNIENGSVDSFLTAKSNDEKINEINLDDNLFPSLKLSQTSETNGNACNEDRNKHLSALNTMDDISMNLFLEDSQTNDDTNGKSFVDSLISETIDKLSKDIEENATDEHYSDTT